MTRSLIHGSIYTLSWAIPVWAFCSLGTACGPKCDPNTFITSWDQSSSHGTADIKGLLNASCPDATSVLEPLLKDSTATAFTTLVDCEADKPVSGSLNDLAVRDQLWYTCHLADKELMTQREFVWASGNPGLAIAIAQTMTEHKVEKELTQAIANRVKGAPILPLDDGFKPATLYAGAPSTNQAASGVLGKQTDDRAALDATTKPADILSALKDSPLTFVGLNSNKSGFAAIQIQAATSNDVTVKSSISIWVSPGKGLTIFNGDEPLPTVGDCAGFTICEGTSADSLAAALPKGAPTAGLRIGWTGSEPKLTKMMDVLGVFGKHWAGVDLKLRWIGEYKPAEVNKGHDDVARWIAGLTPLHNTMSKKMWENKTWARHSGSTTKAWERYDKRHLAEIQAWLPENYGKNDNRTLFYPFSGPDIVNAVTFFPGSRRYILAGLEDIGVIPKAPKSIGGSTGRGLDSFRSSLNNHIARNYFITREMLGMWEKDAMGSHEYNGVTAVMMVFLARTNHEILGIRKVTLNDKGEITASSKLKGKPRAIEITFRKRSSLIPTPHPVKTATFFQGDLKDTSVHKIRGFVPFVSSLGQYNTLLKAASYLMHNRHFDDMRSAVLNRSNHIVMDASGVPYHDLAGAPDTWSLELHGSYNAAISDFYPRCQPDLKKDIATKSKGTLPFRFGYQGKDYHLILATRLKPIESIQLDKSVDIGVDTFFRGNGEKCDKGRQVIDRKKAP